MGIGGTSFLERSQTQANRLKNLNHTLLDLQRQTTTMKKTETLSGLGNDAGSIQRLRTEFDQTQTYINNIDTATSRIKTMSDAMQRVMDIGRDLLGSIQTQVRKGDVDIAQINTMGRNGMDFMKELLNIEIDGRRLFAGTDTTNDPLSDTAALNANFLTEINNWLSGAQSEATMESNIDAFVANNLGYAPTLSASGSVFTRVQDNIDLDYTVRADAAGFRDILKGLALAANMRLPDPMVDVGTRDEMHTALDKVISLTRTGIDNIQSDLSGLSGKLILITSLKDNHKSDQKLLQDSISDIEDVDQTETILKLQSVQQQLTASYEVTRAVSQLSLINYL